MSRFSLEELNPEQRNAVETIDKPLLLLAGAGSGKTRVITYRIAHLISNRQIAPFRILALTFTNKAAKEMRERVHSMLKNQTKGIMITTFHSLCVRFLREFIHLLGYQKDFVIFDTASQLSTIKTIYEDEDIDPKTFNLKATFYEIMKIKGKGKGPEYFLDQKNDPFAQVTGKVFEEYNKTLKGCNALDFEDILYLTIDLFKKYPKETEVLKKRFEYIMVDEYQDTNRVQYRLVKYLTENCRKLCVVGDDDQSIYGWRGADIRNILDFQKDFPEAEVIKLEQNYRSTSVILNAANEVIANNTARMPKNLWTNSGEGELIRWINEDNVMEELEEVVSKMNHHKYTTGDSWSNFAFLYRSNFQSRAVEEQLRNLGIPYQLIGGTKFFDRKEIQDCLAYMKFLHNLKDEVSLFRIINYPKRDLGKTTVMALTQARISRNLSLFEMMEQAEELEELKPRAKKSIKAFVDLVHEFKEKLETIPFNQVFQELFERVGIKAEIEKTEKVDQVREIKINNFLEFINTLYLFEERRVIEGNSATLIDFLDYVSLFTDTDELDQDSGKVSLLTVHSAKGLEFDYVAVVGLTEGQFPNHKAMEEDSLEEERRLFYVALTRAKKVLSLSMSRSRMHYGEWVYTEPSRFLSEIDKSLFDKSPIDPEDPDVVEMKSAKARSSFFSRYKNF
ncbi:MAG: UvrD-helicase domain-containing protein [Proteobacteria bacterium]|nr:UvrD-helicase domain-containing protein [Pseudomonadota bacterium]